MQISWLRDEVISATRAALTPEPDSEEDFTSTFELPPVPAGVSSEEWPRLAEHVARADRVARAVQQQGLERAIAAFRDSRHAVEIAAVAAAARDDGRLDIDLIEALLSCAIDELVAYGAFFGLIVEVDTQEDRERIALLYERFCRVAAARQSPTREWRERVAAMRGGLAHAYIICGRCDAAHEIYQEQHREATEDLVVALGASRTFLSAGEVSRAVQWLAIGAERACDLGRTSMETKLRAKCETLKKRLR